MPMGGFSQPDWSPCKSMQVVPVTLAMWQHWFTESPAPERASSWRPSSTTSRGPPSRVSSRSVRTTSELTSDVHEPLIQDLPIDRSVIPSKSKLYSPPTVQILAFEKQRHRSNSPRGKAGLPKCRVAKYHIAKKATSVFIHSWQATRRGCY